MKVNKKILHGVEQTLLISLLTKAQEYNHKNPIIKDFNAFKIISELKINPAEYKIPKYSSVASLFRSKKLDSYVREYMLSNPGGLVIEIGVGLDNRFKRLDNGTIRWISIDLPNVIRLRKQLIEPDKREKLVSTALEKIKWNSFKKIYNQPLIISEGVFPYFQKEYAAKILENLNKNFKGSIICFDVVHEFVVKNQKFKALEKNKVRLLWGVNNRSEIMTILPDCKIIEEWRYYDNFNIRYGLSNFFKLVPFLNNLFRIYKIQF